VTTGRLRVGDLSLDEGAFALTLDEGGLSLSDGSARLAGGTAAWSLALSRDGARADLTASLSLSEADLGALVWRRGGAPVATGRLDLSAEVATSGYTVAGLVAGLAGAGVLRVDDAVVPGLDAAPLDPVLARLTGGEDPPGEEEVRAAVAEHLSGGALAAEGVEAALAVSGGTVRITDVRLGDGVRAPLASAAADLAAWRIDSDWQFPVASDDGETVHVGMSFEGPLHAPRRTLDVAELTAWLGLRHLERQVRAVEEQNEALEAEADRIDPPLGPPSDGAGGEEGAAPGGADGPGGSGAEAGEAGDTPLPPPPPGDPAAAPHPGLPRGERERPREIRLVPAVPAGAREREGA